VDLDAVRTFAAAADAGRFAQIWRGDNPHPALTALRGYPGAAPRRRGAGTWTPGWARRQERTSRRLAGPR
jgi:hypothetical protein